MPLVWHGEQIKAKMRQAEHDGLLKHGEVVVEAAQSIVAVDSGDLRDDIAVQQQDAFSTGHGFTIEVGSMNLAYAAIQELGPADGRAYSYKPYMRPAADQEAPNLAGRIAEEFK